MNKTKSILMTGCSSGIGYAAALRLQSRGYHVIASCRKKADLEHLQQQGIKHVILLDLDSSSSISSAVDQALSLCDGRLFALFNNGAYGLPGAVEDLTRDALRRQFETNLFGTHELTCKLLPTFLNQPDARIVQNSSVLGFAAMPNRGAYIASKFALEGLTDTLRLELAGTSVKCILIEPGPIISNFRKNALHAFEREINIEQSRHKEMYKKALLRLNKQGPNMRFTLDADAVVDKLILALESKNPKIRYRVTVPTYLMAALKRTLSARMLDAFTLRFGSSG